MRRVTFAFGLTTLAFAWLGPLPELAEHAFFGHMIMHMLVVAVAAPLISVAVAGGPFDPVAKAPALFAPIPASVLELILVWGWHAPALHHLARSSVLGLVAEQGTFLFAGLAVWLSAFGGSRPRSPARSASGVVGLLLTAMHMTLLGALIGLSPRPLYRHHLEHGEAAALADQHLGGAVMLIVGGAAYLIGGLWLTVDLLRERLKRPVESAPPAQETAIDRQSRR